MQNIPTKMTGDTLTAVEFNDIPDEMENVITSTGIVLSGLDLTQMSKSIANYAGSGASYADSGTSTAYVLSPIGLNKGPTAYVDGMVINFIASNTNTSTIPTANVNGLGAKTIEQGAAGSISNGDITVDYPIRLVFSTGDDAFLLTKPIAASTDNSGILELATDAETQTGTDAIRAVTPASLASFPSDLASKYTNATTAYSGHATMPGGLVIQWGFTGKVATGTAISFDIPFTTSLFTITLGNDNTASGGSAQIGLVDDPTLTGFDYHHAIGDATESTFYMALGI